MTIIEQIHQLPLHEKLLAFEAIWDDITREESVLRTPQWHRDILDERAQLIENGKAEFIEWEKAKEQIRASVR